MKPDYSHVYINQVSPNDKEVINLIDQLNRYQVDLYGLENCNLESPQSLKDYGAFMIGAYIKNRLVAIGAVKFFPDYGEIKRMFVEKSFRGMGLAEKILGTLEKQALSNNIKIIRLETGKLHTAALSFYKKMGYSEIKKFGIYEPNKVSIYYEKKIS